MAIKAIKRVTLNGFEVGFEVRRGDKRELVLLDWKAGETWEAAENRAKLVHARLFVAEARSLIAEIEAVTTPDRPLLAVIPGSATLRTPSKGILRLVT